MVFDWVPGATLGVAGAALAWWRSAGISEAKFQERLTQVKEEMAKGALINQRSDDAFKQDLCAAINELRAVTLTIAKLSSGQDVINAVTNKALETLARKSEEQDKRINENQSVAGLIREWLERQERKP